MRHIIRDCALPLQVSAALPAHSIKGFFWPPTMHSPKARSESRSLARMMERAGSIGLLASTREASLAACSMASISSLQPCWSSGHITIRCRRAMSRAELSCTCGLN